MSVNSCHHLILQVLQQREELERKNADEKGELDNLEKARILANFEKEAKALNDAREAERINQKSKLRNRLADKKAKAAQKKPSQPPPQSMVDGAAAAGGGAGDGDASPKKPAASSKWKLVSMKSIKMTKGDIATGTSGDVAATGTSATTASAAPAPTVVAPAAPAVPAAMTPALANSIRLIESKLERIERVMLALEKRDNQDAHSHSAAAAASHQQQQQQQQAAQAPVASYLDGDEPSPGEALVLVPEEVVHVQEQARIEFGLRLASLIGLKNLRIRAAYALPPPKASNNAFCNSYLYDRDTDSLLVHRDRLASSGDFGLIVVHALSHIKVHTYITRTALLPMSLTHCISGQSAVIFTFSCSLCVSVYTLLHNCHNFPSSSNFCAQQMFHRNATNPNPPSSFLGESSGLVQRCGSQLRGRVL